MAGPEKPSGSELSKQRLGKQYANGLTVDTSIQLMAATEVVDADDESFPSRHVRRLAMAIIWLRSFL
jgi:hypothetical protein